ncbi:hypothetical protein PInf_009262 [Phytophthora infestans]|nr:hypothetical protein PInf_009262 [Phytophthora infestans]
MQVVGDSAMILGLMRRRKAPKARKLQHWFRLARKLADQGQVQVWQHHYRQHNKTADGLANFAMDTGKSVMFTAEAEGMEHELRALAEIGITATRDGDAQGFHTDGVVFQRVNIRAEIIQRMILTGASVETISECSIDKVSTWTV